MPARNIEGKQLEAATIKTRELGVLANKGELITYSALGADEAVLSPGTNGYLLASNTGVDLGLGWVNPATIGGTEYQQAVTSASYPVTTDAVLVALSNIPLVSAASLKLWLNGIFQEQGAGKDYTVVPATGVITWLAGTGTAVDLASTDSLWADYRA